MYSLDGFLVLPGDLYTHKQIIILTGVYGIYLRNHWQIYRDCHP